LIAVLSRRDRLMISICIVLITALAWAYLVYLARQMSSSMEYGVAMAKMGMSTHLKWTVADLFFTFVMWSIMMVGMMTGTAAPMLLLYAGAQARRQPRGVSFSTLAFGLAYVMVWVGFSACAAAAQWALHEAAMLSPTMSTSSPKLAGGILILAGMYQLTPFKGKCLTHCRSPLGFLMTNWRDGTTGAFQMGLRHGAYCLGCCWALMCVLFVVGVMNLVWVAALTVFVLVEKIGPASILMSRVAGAAMLVFGLAFVVGVG
jgi:predicted metal-binding membrane protein